MASPSKSTCLLMPSSVKAYSYVIVTVSIMVSAVTQVLMIIIIWHYYGDHIWWLGSILLAIIGFIFISFLVIIILSHLFKSTKLNNPTYVHERFPQNPFLPDPSLQEYSHAERIKQHQIGGGVLPGTPVLIDPNRPSHHLTSLSLAQSSTTVLKESPPRPSHFTMYKESGVDFVDAYWAKQIHDFKMDHQRQRKGQRSSSMKKSQLYEPKYVQCELCTCDSPSNCRHDHHIHFAGNCYHCLSTIIDKNIQESPTPTTRRRKKAGTNKTNLDPHQNKMSTDFFQSREKEKNWSAPNDYPGRNIHGFVAKNWPQCTDHETIVNKSDENFNNNLLGGHHTLKRPVLSICSCSTTTDTDDQYDGLNVILKPSKTTSVVHDSNLSTDSHRGTRRVESSRSHGMSGVVCKFNSCLGQNKKNQDTSDSTETTACESDEDCNKNKVKSIVPKVLLLFHNSAYEDY